MSNALAHSLLFLRNCDSFRLLGDFIVRCGLTTTAFNMLPVGCLDGGRAVQVVLLFMERCIFYLKTRSLILPSRNFGYKI